MAKISINLATGTLQKPELIVGIDLGNSTSLVSFIDPDQKPKAINDTGKGVSMPSVVNIQSNGKIITGMDARELLIAAPERTIRLWRNVELAGRSEYEVDGKSYHANDLSAELLKELRRRAEHALKTPVNRAVIAVPASYSGAQQQDVIASVSKSGLELMGLVSEAGAAGLVYADAIRSSSLKRIAVYQFGSSHFDFSVMTVDQGVVRIIGTKGTTSISGEKIDQLIVNYWIDKNQISDSRIQNDASVLEMLWLKAEEAKIALTTQNLFNEQVGDIWFSLDKKRFTDLIVNMVKDSIDLSTGLLDEISVGIVDIDEIVLVGGNTVIPEIASQVTSVFGKTPSAIAHAEEIVVLGAAIQADIIAGNRSDLKLEDLNTIINESLRENVSAEAAKPLIQVKGEASLLASTAERFVERNTFVLNSMEITEARQRIADLRKSLDGDSSAEILNAAEELNKCTRVFGDRLMAASRK